MKVNGALLFLVAKASALVIYDTRDAPQSATEVAADADASGGLVARASYQLGVNIFTNAHCAGNVVAVRNHDEHSCNAATTHNGGFNYISARVKSDGTAHGHGCLTTFTGSNCQGASRSYAIDKDQCIDFGTNIGCVVVSSRQPGDACSVQGPDC